MIFVVLLLYDELLTVLDVEAALCSAHYAASAEVVDGSLSVGNVGGDAVDSSLSDTNRFLWGILGGWDIRS